MIRRKRKRKKIFKFLFLTVLICTLVVIAFNIYKNKKLIFPMFNKNTTKTYEDKIKLADNVETSNTNKLPVSKVNLTTNPLAKASDNSEFNKLNTELKEMCTSNGVWSIYIKDLKSGQHFTINNKKMVAASLIKLFIMAKTYEAIDSKQLEKSKEISELLKKMITVSHNESSNKLVEILGSGSHKSGMYSVNKFALSKDCINTEQQRDMKDSRPVPVAGENYTGVEDCAKLLESIYNNECISPEFDKEMMNLLLAQERNSKLPALIPKDTKIAHKTGELEKTENDVGIVFGPKTDYIICVMTSELENTNEARKRISQISKVVYDFLEK